METQDADVSISIDWLKKSVDVHKIDEILRIYSLWLVFAEKERLWLTVIYIFVALKMMLLNMISLWWLFSSTLLPHIFIDFWADIFVCETAKLIDEALIKLKPLSF